MRRTIRGGRLLSSCLAALRAGAGALVASLGMNACWDMYRNRLPMRIWPLGVLDAQSACMLVCGSVASLLPSYCARSSRFKVADGQGRAGQSRATKVPMAHSGAERTSETSYFGLDSFASKPSSPAGPRARTICDLSSGCMLAPPTQVATRCSSRAREPRRTNDDHLDAPTGVAGVIYRSKQ